MNANDENIVDDTVKKNDEELLFGEFGEKSWLDCIRTVWNRVLNIKMKTILLLLSCCLLFGVIVLFFYYLASPLYDFLKYILKTPVSMAFGMHYDSDSHNVLDGDLLATIPLCLCVALFVCRSCSRFRWGVGILYFVVLMVMLEIWDSWFVDYFGAREYLGGTCFVIMFVIIPVLARIGRNCGLKSNQTSHESSKQIEYEI